MISMVKSFYKLVDKVITNRLGLVMNEMISTNQPTILKGILLFDGVVAINKVFDLDKCTIKAYLICKVDFEKAYDSVS